MTQNPPRSRRAILKKARSLTAGGLSLALLSSCETTDAFANLSRDIQDFGSKAHKGQPSSGANGFWSRLGRTSHSSSSRGDKIAARARSWVGRSYRHGYRAQCASFVSSVLSSEDIPYRAAARAFDSDAIGPRVKRSKLQPGDIVMFQRTYPSKHRITHVGIYVGDGQFVHRSTRRSSVVLASLNSGHFAPRFYTARRIA